ncbi:MAG TPA: cation-transporting P-type ATPase, partial [Polyangiaceae bacterium]|nr:cation-transporting P-type ATPase [Polyangiaceae bacterium]
MKQNEPRHSKAAREPLAELLGRLATSAGGLSSAEARNRLDGAAASGVTRAGPHGAGAEFLRAVLNPLTLILLAAAIAAAFVGQVADAAIIVGIVTLSTGLNFWQTFRSQRAVRELQRGVAPTAWVVRDGATVRVPRAQLVVGDVIRLTAGSLVPADARVIEARDLHVQQSALTGESLPV